MLPTHVITLSSLLSISVWVGLGDGVGFLLGRAVPHVLKHKRVGVHTQGTTISPHHQVEATRIAFPPRPTERHTDELFLSGFDAQIGQWKASAWKSAPEYKQTDTRETTHIRQRLQTLQLSYLDDFPDKRNTDEHYQIQKVHGKIFLQKAMNNNTRVPGRQARLFPDK